MKTTVKGKEQSRRGTAVIGTADARQPASSPWTQQRTDDAIQRLQHALDRRRAAH